MINNSTIPAPFAAINREHRIIFDRYKIPNAAQHIMIWLYERYKPGRIQEFNKESYDEYCDRDSIKKISLNWFKHCVKKIESSGLIKIVAHFKKRSGGGYQAIAYHPWQIKQDCDRSCKENFSNRNAQKTNQTDRETYKTDTSNADSTVPSYRESKEIKYNTIQENSDRTKEKACDRLHLKSSVAASLSKLKEKYIKPKNQECLTKHENSAHIDPQTNQKVEYTVEVPKPCIKPKTDKDRSVGKKDVESSKGFGGVEEKVKKNEYIVNKKWRSHLDHLDELGIQCNDTITSYVKRYKTDEIEAAIVLIRNKKRESAIANPNGYFVQCLKEKWFKETAIAENTDPQAVFGVWYGLAKEFGYCSGSEDREDGKWVLISGAWERFVDAIARGFTLDYLMKMKKQR